ncbi:TLR4 interactor with leucine rich repeats [Conger conger]|uniref:TLR4 interactor with leucine rich repeats n=1 Tax=Conger conger TaxID=82655 RepID=UPI002A5985FB|nr:TLR4 interactor with leucine rich repeats [Conger conger]
METVLALFFILLSGCLSVWAICPDRCDCQHAQHLVCTNRGLRAVPKVATRSSGDVLVFSLGGNFIGNISAFDMSRFSRLTRLDLQYNRIQTVHPKAFEKLSRLEELYLGNNLLSGISAGTLQPLKKLRILDANSNEIDKITADTFVNLENVIKLRLDGNSIQTLHDSVFKGMGSLLYLHLESNRLRHIHRNAFAKLEKLRFLDLSDNKQTALRDVHAFSPLTSLATLLVAGNEIQLVGNYVFQNLRSLTRLSLSNNNISLLEPAALDGLSSVRELLIDGNQLAEVPGRLLDPLMQLEELDLSRNRISRLHPSAFSRLKQLKVLKLNSNRLTSIPGTVFAANGGLYRLDLSGNEWICGCALAGFKEWIRRAHSTGRLLAVFLRCRQPARLAGKYLDYLETSELQPAGNLTCVPEQGVQADQGQPGQSQQSRRRKGGAPRARPRPHAAGSLKRVRAEPMTGVPSPEATPTILSPGPSERVQQLPLVAEACKFSRFLFNVSADQLSPTSARLQWELRPALAPPPRVRFRVRYDRFAATAPFPRFLYLGGGARGVTLQELAANQPYVACVEGVVGGAVCEVASRDHCAGVLTQHALQDGGGGLHLQLVTVVTLAANALLLLAVGGAWAGRGLRRGLRRKSAVSIRHMYSSRRPLGAGATEPLCADFTAYQSSRPRGGGADEGDLIQFVCDRFHDNSPTCREDATPRFQD